MPTDPNAVDYWPNFGAAVGSEPAGGMSRPGSRLGPTPKQPPAPLPLEDIVEVLTVRFLSSGFQDCSSHTRCLQIMPQSSPRSRILENFDGSQEENFSGYAAMIPVCAKKTHRFINYIKNTIFISRVSSTIDQLVITSISSLAHVRLNPFADLTDCRLANIFIVICV